MEIIGDDKRLRALYSEAQLVDEQVAPSFSATWQRAQSRVQQPRRAFNVAFASALALVIFAVAAFAIWSRYSQPRQSYSAYAAPAAATIATPVENRNSESSSTAINVSYRSVSRTPRVNRHSTQHQQLMIAENRRAEQAAKQIASWQSPTSSLLNSSSDDLFKSLPQLNENATELKSFLPNRNNDKDN